MAIYSSVSNQFLTNTSTPIFNNVTSRLVVVPTAAGTTILTASSANGIVFTGSTTQTVTMPVVSTLTLGTSYRIVNRSSGDITVNSSGADLIQTMISNSSLILTCVALTGTDASSWETLYVPTAPFEFPLAPDLGGTGSTDIPANGQIPIGNGTNYTIATLTQGNGVDITVGSGSITVAADYTSLVGSIIGTANQVLANGTSGSNQVGDVTLTLPQDIATSSTPTFAGVTAGNVNIASNTVSTTNTNGIMALIPNGTGGVSVGSTTIAYTPSSSVLVTSLNQNNKFASLNLYSYEGSGSFGGTLNLYGSKSTTIGSYSIVANTNVLGTIAFNADTGSNFATRATITCNVDGAPVGSVVPTNLKFNTASSAGGNTTALTISSSQIATFASSIVVTSDSTISGVDIGRGNNSSATNSRFGVAANGAMTSGTYNTSLGYSACNLITQGSANTCVGSFSGSNNIVGSAQITTASNNTLIGYSASTNSSTSGGVIALGINALAEASTGSTSGTNGPGIAIGAAGNKVGFRGDGSIFPGNLWRVKVNGTYYMIPLAADGSTSLPVANGGTGITSFGTGVATALGVNLNNSSSNGLATTSYNTYTPVLAFGGSSTGITYNSAFGNYVTIGSLCIVNIGINLSNKGSSTGNATISLPVVAGSISNTQNIAINVVQQLIYTGTMIGGTIAAAGSVVTLNQSTTTSNIATLTDANFSNNTQIYCTFCYIKV